MPLKLIRNLVGIEPVRDNDKIGSLYVPEIAKTRVKQGPIKSLGPDCTGDLRIGDYVLFSAYSGTLIAHDSEVTLVIPEDNIDAILIPDFPIYIEGKAFAYSELLKHIANSAEVNEFNVKLNLRSGDERKISDRGFAFDKEKK